MKLKFVVVGVSTLPSKLISVTLKNLSIPDEKIPIKSPNITDAFNVDGMMQSAMAAVTEQQQKMLGINPNISKVVLSPEEFDGWRVTVGDEVEFTMSEVLLRRDE